MAKMWAGRTSGEINSLADSFNSSISFDSRLYRQDIKGSIAHASMLSKQGIISFFHNFCASADIMGHRIRKTADRSEG